MNEDYKERYLEDQRRQASARQDRLAKIGMGTNKTTPAQNTQSRRTTGQVPNQYSQQRPAQRPQTQRTVQSQRPVQQQRPVRNIQSTYNNIPYETANLQDDSDMIIRPRTKASTSQQRSTQTPVAPYGVAPVYRPNSAGQVSQQRPVQRPQAQTGAQPYRNPQQRPAQTQQRPVQSQQRPQPQYQNVPRQNRDYSEDRLFKKNLTEEESRAMMFSLTGRAQSPENTGTMDIVDTGVRKKNDTPLYTKQRKTPNKKVSKSTYIGRGFIVFGSLLLALVITLYTFLLVVAYGPSESFRNQLILMANQSSAAKWVPYLVMSKGTVQGIIDRSKETVQDVISIDDYVDDEDDEEAAAAKEEEWASAINGMIFETVNGSTYKAYVLLVKDPSRVFVGTSTDDFSNATAGVDVFEAADRYGAIACINGGEFLDNGGHGSGYAPLGLTYSQGECVFDDGSLRTFFGITENNELVVREGMTRAEADELHIRDGVAFQTGNTLIEKKGDQLVMYYADGNTGTSQRTAIGQRSDGTFILIVTDGRTASCPGATHNDMIDLMVSYGAVSAGMLDGGSSSMMFYRDYYNIYNIDTSTLDQYQLRGLVNNYKAFTNPRKIPSFFMVKPEA